MRGNVRHKTHTMKWYNSRMPELNRRQFLASVGAISLSGLAGCSSMNQISNLTKRKQFRIAWIDLPNFADIKWDVTMTIKKDDKVVFEMNHTVPVNTDGQGLWRIQEPWMDEIAHYEIDLKSHSPVEDHVRAETIQASEYEQGDDCMVFTIPLRVDHSIGLFTDHRCSD